MTQDQFERLLQCEPFLRRLARRLLKGDARADDVVQEAWLVALRNGNGDVGPGWLAGVVKNLARRVRRDDARRRRREQAAARDERVDGPVAGADEARRRLVALVLALPDHYRAPILLRYYDGLEPQEIAERLDLNPSTVRTRLQRALERLRGQIDGSLSAALAAVAWREPRRLWPATLTGAAAAVLLAWLALPPALETPPRASPASAPTLRTAAAERGDGVLHVATAPSGETVAEAPQLLAGKVELFPGALTRAVRLEVQGAGHVVDGEFAVPVAGDGPWRVRATHPEAEELTALVRTSPVTLRLRRRALVDADTLAPVAPAQELAVETPEEEQEAVPAPSIRRGGPRGDATLRGIVLLPPDVEPERARLLFGDAWTDVAPGRPFALPVRLPDELPAAVRVTAYHAGTRPLRVDVPVRAGPQLDYVELALERARTVRGTVELSGEGPGEGVTVAAYAERDGVPAAEPESVVQANAQGAFEIVLGAGRAYYVVAAAPGWRAAGAWAEDELRLALVRGLALTGRAPAEGAVVRAVAAEDPPAVELALGEERLAWTADALRWRERTTRADADARYALGGLEPVEYLVTCGEETQSAFPPAELDFEAPPVRLEVLVRSGGVALADARVAVGDRLEVTDAEGRALFELPPQRTYAVSVAADGLVSQDRTVKPPRAEFDLKPPGELAELEVRLDPRGGVALPATCVFTLSPPYYAGAPQPRTVGMGPGGVFVLRDLDPGTYDLTAKPGGWFLETRVPVSLRARERTSVTVVVQAGGRVTLDFFSDRTDARVPCFVALDPDPGLWSPYAVTAETTWTWILPPNVYSALILPADADHDLGFETLDVRAGQTMRLRVTLTKWASGSGPIGVPDMRIQPQLAR